MSDIIKGNASFRCEIDNHAGNLYSIHFEHSAEPPYTSQRRVEAIIDISLDGRLAAVELIDNMPPPPEGFNMKSIRDRCYYDRCTSWTDDDAKELMKRNQPKICKQSWLVPRPWYIKLWRKVTFRKPERYEPSFDDIKQVLFGIERVGKEKIKH